MGFGSTLAGAGAVLWKGTKVAAKSLWTAAGEAAPQVVTASKEGFGAAKASLNQLNTNVSAAIAKDGFGGMIAGYAKKNPVTVTAAGIGTVAAGTFGAHQMLKPAPGKWAQQVMDNRAMAANDSNYALQSGGRV